MKRKKTDNNQVKQLSLFDTDNHTELTFLTSKDLLQSPSSSCKVISFSDHISENEREVRAKFYSLSDHLFKK